MRSLVVIVVVVLAGGILADLLAHPTSTNNLLTSGIKLWESAIKGASGGYAVAGQ